MFLKSNFVDVGFNQSKANGLHLSYAANDLVSSSEDKLNGVSIYVIGTSLAVRDKRTYFKNAGI
jgi:hypothetical protein